MIATVIVIATVIFAIVIVMFAIIFAIVIVTVMLAIVIYTFERAIYRHFRHNIRHRVRHSHLRRRHLQDRAGDLQPLQPFLASSVRSGRGYQPISCQGLSALLIPSKSPPLRCSLWRRPFSIRTTVSGGAAKTE